MDMTKPLLMLLIRGYQKGISVWLPASCRFQPTCSAYALEAIATHGSFKGTWLACRRIVKCHPLHPGGYDPVPPLEKSETLRSSSESSPDED